MAIAETFTADLAEARRQYEARTPEEIEADIERSKQPKASPEFLASLRRLAASVRSLAKPRELSAAEQAESDRVMAAEEAKWDEEWAAYLAETGRAAEIEKPKYKRIVRPFPAALDGVTVGRNVDWTDVGGVLAGMRDHVLDVAPYPNRPLARKIGGRPRSRSLAASSPSAAASR